MNGRAVRLLSERIRLGAIQYQSEIVWIGTTKKGNLGRDNLYNGHLGFRVAFLGLGLNADGHRWFTLQLSHFGAMGLHICSSSDEISSHQSNAANRTGQE